MKKEENLQGVYTAINAEAHKTIKAIAAQKVMKFPEMARYILEKSVEVKKVKLIETNPVDLE